MSTLDFSLVTTCRNEIRSIDRWKRNILDQTRPPSEIVIVDAFSDDGTAEQLYEWVAHDSRVKVIQEKGAAAHGRNVAIQNSKYEILLSTDMGVRLSQNWCEELIRPFETDHSVEVVVGNTCNDKETISTAVARAEYYYESGGESKLGPGSIPGNRSVAYTRKVWSAINGLPEDLTFYADDSVFGRQLVQENFKFAYAPGAMTFWARPNKLSQFNKEYFVYGRGDGEAFIKTFAAYRWYLSGIIPIFLVPFLTSAIHLLKPNLFKGMARALKKRDLAAALLVPVLTESRWFHYAKGYHIGYTHGKEYCLDCRARLQRNEKGYCTF